MLLVAVNVPAGVYISVTLRSPVMLTVDVSIETPPELVIDPTSSVPVILTFGASIVTFSRALNYDLRIGLNRDFARRLNVDRFVLLRLNVGCRFLSVQSSHDHAVGLVKSPE